MPEGPHRVRPKDVLREQVRGKIAPMDTAAMEEWIGGFLRHGPVVPPVQTAGLSDSMALKSVYKALPSESQDRFMDAWLGVLSDPESKGDQVLSSGLRAIDSLDTIPRKARIWVEQQFRLRSLDGRVVDGEDLGVRCLKILNRAKTWESGIEERALEILRGADSHFDARLVAFEILVTRSPESFPESMEAIAPQVSSASAARKLARRWRSAADEIGYVPLLDWYEQEADAGHLPPWLDEVLREIVVPWRFVHQADSPPAAVLLAGWTWSAHRLLSAPELLRIAMAREGSVLEGRTLRLLREIEARMRTFYVHAEVSLWQDDNMWEILDAHQAIGIGEALHSGTGPSSLLIFDPSAPYSIFTRSRGNRVEVPEPQFVPIPDTAAGRKASERLNTIEEEVKKRNRRHEGDGESKEAILGTV